MSERRNNAIQYANLWSEQGSALRNPNYPDFGSNDCTNFVSQAMYAAEYPMVGSGDGCEQEMNYDEWYVSPNPDPSFLCLGDTRYWKWAGSWSLAGDFREFFAHRSNNAIEIGYTEDAMTAAYYLDPGDVVQLMIYEDLEWITYHTMIVTDENQNGLFVTYHSGEGGYDAVDRPLSDIDTSPVHVFMLVRMFPDNLYFPLVKNGNNNLNTSIDVYPAPEENYEENADTSLITAYPTP